MDPFLQRYLDSPWSAYKPAGVHGFRGQAFELGVAHANTGGQDSTGTDIQPIPPSNAGTTALGTAGVAYANNPNAQFDSILTALINKNLISVLRDDLVVLQAGAFLRANYVPGSKTFRYVFFGDLGAADSLLEGVPPVTAPMVWDTFEFTGTQKGKLVAITDLAELFSSFDLYSVAAEKLAWNAALTAETDAITLLTGATTGVAVLLGLAGGAAPTPTRNIVNTVTALKKADVPMFPDGTYHTLISPNDAAKIMLDATVGPTWYDTLKYTDNRPLLNGELGMYRGIRFIESNLIPDGKSVTFGPGAVVWGDYQTIQTYRVAAGGDHADPLAQRSLLGWKGMWGMALVAFDGSPAAGPASNTLAYRFTQGDLLKTA